MTREAVCNGAWGMRPVVSYISDTRTVRSGEAQQSSDKDNDTEEEEVPVEPRRLAEGKVRPLGD